MGGGGCGGKESRQLFLGRGLSHVWTRLFGSQAVIDVTAVTTRPSRHRLVIFDNNDHLNVKQDNKIKF